MRVVVVGAGVGGLAAAARLAAAGHAVTVCEQADALGGKLGLFERDGFRFDTGPSLLTMPHVFAELFRDTAAPGRLRPSRGAVDAAAADAVAAAGVPPADPLERGPAAGGVPAADTADLGPLTSAGVDLVALDPIARYRFPDGTWLDAHAESDRTADAFDAALGSGTGDQWRSFLGRAARIWDAVEGPFLREPLTGVGQLLRLSRGLRDLAAVAPHRTLRGLGRQYLRDPRQRMLLERYATYTGSDPRRAPAALATIPYVEQRFGAWHVRGGMRHLGEAIADRARERGAVIRTDADVTRVDVSGGRANGVHLADGERLPADAVVANGDAAHLYADLVRDPAADAARRRLRRASPSLSGFVVLLGVRGRTPGLARHTVLFPADYDAEFDAIFGRPPRPVDDPTVYLSVPQDEALAPRDCEAWFVLVNAPRHEPGRGVDWRAPGLADRYADRVLAVTAARGIDVRDRVIFREVITPADLDARTRSPGGAIYGTSSNGVRAAFLRPANRSPIPGLYLVGGSSHPGGGLPLVALSARIVAEMIGPA